MRKLYKIKKWYTLDEAADRLSLTMGEPIGVQDIRQFMADGLIDAYCNVRGIYAMEVAPASVFMDSCSELTRISKSFGLPDGHWPSVSQGLAEQAENVATLDGLFKIEVKGENVITVTDRRWRAAIADGIEGEYLSNDDVGGDVMLSDIDGKLWELRFPDYQNSAQHSPWLNARNFCPVFVLPEGTEIVLSTSEIEKCEALLSDEPIDERPLSTKERNSLLVMIAALCKEVGLAYDARGVAPEIVRMADLIGVPMDSKTVLTALKQIPDAMGARQREAISRNSVLKK